MLVRALQHAHKQTNKQTGAGTNAHTRLITGMVAWICHATGMVFGLVTLTTSFLDSPSNSEPKLSDDADSSSIGPFAAPQQRMTTLLPPGVDTCRGGESTCPSILATCLPILLAVHLSLIQSSYPCTLSSLCVRACMRECLHA